MFSLSNHIDKVDFTFWFIVGISAVLLLLITVLMIYFVFKYNRKKNPKPENIHGNMTLEILWTVIPVILVMGMFYFGWVGFKETTVVPADAIEVNVVGQMWKWNFEYSNGLKTDTLYVPLNKPVKLNLSSIDVNHSFFIPAFRFKKDAMLNKPAYIWFMPDKLGSFDIACAEYCGLQHSYMYTKLVIVPEEEFSYWLISEKEKMNAALNSSDTNSVNKTN